MTVTAKQQDKHLDSAPMPELAVTVSQTENLVAQGIRLNWTGGKKSTGPSAGGNGGENFLQIFMCWGTDPTDSTRPDRTTCQYGGTEGVGATRDAFRNFPISETPAADLEYTAPNVVSFLPPLTAIPFVARDGSRVDRIVTDPVAGKSFNDTNINTNQFFTSQTTNEIPWAGSGNDGKGSVSFEVQTVVQANALGCGSPVTVGTTTTGAGCWLVILPRGTADNGSTNITQSGLFADSWQHALSVPLDFAPVGSHCPEDQAERQIAGSELAALAVNAWQPVVCNEDGGSVFSLITGAESDAVSTAATSSTAPLALTSYPYRREEGSGGADPLAYAPVALTGISISVAIDRLPDPNDMTIPQEYRDAARSAFTTVNLTPRLLAKLLSYSYRSALPRGADLGYITGTNVYNITEDPDFLKVNDEEWAVQDLGGPAIADIIVPQGRSDAARAVWAYISADAEARDFLASKPDPWGMIVNPYYSTDAAINPNGSAFELDRDDFPKADPVEALPKNEGPVNLITWRPYANDLDSVSYLTLRGDGQGLGGWDPFALPAPKYGKSARSLPGEQRLIGLTSASSAERYQVVTASLENPADKFVPPTTAGMLAAAEVMSPVSGSDQVAGIDQQSAAAQSKADAYPLTLPVYAASNPTLTERPLRAAYAQFIRYAVSDQGQTSGVDVGQLPKGYAPLPDAWVTSALAVAGLLDPPTPAAPEAESAPYIPTQQPASTTTRTAAGTAPAPPAAVPVPATHAATGTASGALSGGTTPDDPEIGAIAAAVPASLLAGVGGAAAVPLITRLRRRVT